MCGLVFTIQRDPFSYHLDDFFGDAMLASQVRGIDAAGLFQVDKNHGLFTKKKAVPASEFVKDRQVQHIITDANKCPLTVGHVRHATQGDKDDDNNAHPFVFEREDKTRVVGVHNGSLKGWKGKKGAKEEVVDSAWAIKMIADEGLDAFTHFDGPFAFIWWDSREPDSVWIARNSERTLYYYVADDGKSLMGCSELGMLGWLTAKHGFGKHKNGDTGLFYFEPNYCYKLSLKEVGQMKRFELPKYDPKTTISESSTTESLVHYFPAGSGGEGARCDVPFRQNEGPIELGPTGVIQSRIGTAATTTRGNTPTYTKDQYPTIVKAKIALRRARDRRLGRSGYAPPTEDPMVEDEIVTTEVMDRNLETGIQRALNDAAIKRKLDPWKFVEADRRVSKANDRSATSEEITRAVYNKVFGRVVPLMGVDWDDETCELLGEAYVMAGGKQITIDCCLRNIPQKVARDVYINGPEPVLVCVIGEIESKGQEPPMYVVANLDLANRIELGRMDMKREVATLAP